MENQTRMSSLVWTVQLLLSTMSLIVCTFPKTALFTTAIFFFRWLYVGNRYMFIADHILFQDSSFKIHFLPSTTHELRHATKQ